MVIILLIVGFILLIKGANLLVDGSTNLAKHFGISDIVIGLTVVAFGTSMPELIVNIISSVNGANGISIGNIVGSNIANILLILGVAAIIKTITVYKNTVWNEIPFSLFSAFILLFLANGHFFNEAQQGIITRSDGLILLSFFAVFLYYTFSLTKKPIGKIVAFSKKNSLAKSILIIILGTLALFLGGKWVVESAIALTKLFKVSETIVGITIVALGTSLPELVTSIVASIKKNSDIVVGNVVGSNIFNILWVLGLSSIISPITVEKSSNADFYMLIIASLLLFGFLFIGNPDKSTKTVNRWQGFVFVALYLGYILFRVI